MKESPTPKRKSSSGCSAMDEKPRQKEKGKKKSIFCVFFDVFPAKSVPVLMKPIVAQQPSYHILLLNFHLRPVDAPPLPNCEP